MRRRTPNVRTALVVVLVLAVCVCSTAAFAGIGTARPQLTGTWSGKYGGAFSGTFTIHWKLTRARLKGTILLSKPHGTYSITGSYARGAISFGAVDVGAKYSGAMTGKKSMAGRYTTPQGGGSWSAHKTS